MSDNAASSLGAVLNALNVPRQRVIYVQASADWIQRAGFESAAVLPALIDRIGDAGTLVMPSYPFHTTHREYLAGHPVFDVRRTPSAIGLLPEMFRRVSGAVRSLDPDFCVTAFGREAGAIVGTDPATDDPFAMDSSYQRMLDRGATLVGLGVSLNTTSFIHVIDSRCAAAYPSSPYDDRRFAATVTDAGGVSREIARLALRPEFQQRTVPSAVIDAMQPGVETFAALEINGARFFRWDLDRWSAWCLDHARRQAAAGAWPCWLAHVDRAEAAGPT